MWHDNIERPRGSGDFELTHYRLSHSLAFAILSCEHTREKEVRIMIAEETAPNQVLSREWATRTILLQAVLRYLAQNGPTNWVTLYLHFDGTGEIGPALGAGNL